MKGKKLTIALIGICALLVLSGCKKHVHDTSGNTDWQTDENTHWKACECGEKYSVENHSDENEDEKCDTCGYAFKTAPLATAEQMKNVEILKTASAGGAVTAHPGGRVTYTISVTNNASDRITVNVTDILPEGTVFVDGCSNVSGKNLSWEVKNIFPGKTKTVTYTFSAN
jgi:uncharacterized repeat protein (TIGR01451 family)